MDGMTLLQEARAAGLSVTAEGGQLKIRGPQWADPIAKKLIAHKPAVLSALQAAKLPGPPPDVSPWDLPPEWYSAWEERACIIHYDGGLHWEHAEALALADILRRMREASVPLPRVGI